ncbi:MAG: PQQ-binding-like beta-propeller repeat protein [Bacillota bacterium]
MKGKFHLQTCLWLGLACLTAAGILAGSGEIKVEKSINYHPAFYADRMYLLSGGFLKEYDLRTGADKLLCKIDYRNYFQSYNPYLAISGDRIFIFRYKKPLICMDRSTAEVYWETPYFFNYISPPRICGGKIIASQINHEINAIDVRSGEILWTFNRMDEHVISYGLGEEYCYASTALKKLYILRLSDGSLVSASAISLLPRSIQPVKKGCLLLQDFATTLATINEAGQDLNILRFSGPFTAFAKDGRIYAVTSSGKVYGLSEALEVQWICVMQSRLTRHLFFYQGALAALGEDGKLFFLNADNGSLVKTVETDVIPVHAELYAEQKKFIIFGAGCFKILDLDQTLGGEQGAANDS